MVAAMTDDDPDLQPPLAQAWAYVKHLIEWCGALYGDPTRVARTLLYSRRECDDIASWLRAIEQILRRVLLIEAAALPKPDSKVRTPRRLAPRVRRIVEHVAEAPEAWRVRFQLVAPEHRSTRRRNAAQPAPIRYAWPLAERLEALLRVVENPAPYIARVARRLHHRPDLARRIAKPLKRKERPGLADYCISLLEPQLHAAPAVFCNSS
jgi:hypothetical protein